MLVLADRGFYGFKLWRIACLTQASLLWRVKANLGLPVEKLLDDGSYLSTVFDSEDDRARRDGQVVRVIDYRLEGSATPGEDSYRLVTNLLDPQSAPALELAALYHDSLRAALGSQYPRRTTRRLLGRRHHRLPPAPQLC
jgi:hypothetical protein